MNLPKAIERAYAMGLREQFEHDLVDCGLDPNNIDYDKLPDARKRFDDSLVAIVEKAVEEERNKYLEALQWCSGSQDFQIEGNARNGWEKLCMPLLSSLKGSDHKVKEGV